MNLGVRIIEDTGLRKALLDALASDEESRILESALLKGKSVLDLIRECDIPHTSAYRLVNEMKQDGLLVVERLVMTEDGKRYAIYRSAFKSIQAKFGEGGIRVEAEANPVTTDRVFRIFYSLPDGESGGK